MSTIGLTAEQALTELRNNPQNYRTPEQLKALVDRVLVYLPSAIPGRTAAHLVLSKTIRIFHDANVS